jgi:hypothetical protein
MDSNRFDTLAKSLSGSGTRRGLVRLVTALPLAGALGRLLGEERALGQGNGAGVGGGGGRRQRRNARHRHDPGHDKDNRKGKRRGKRKDKNRGTPASAPAGCSPTTCAAQGKTCGSILDGCGGTLNCGSCSPTCTTGTCPADQTCQSNGTCLPNGHLFQCLCADATSQSRCDPEAYCGVPYAEPSFDSVCYQLCGGPYFGLGTPGTSCTTICTPE